MESRAMQKYAVIVILALIACHLMLSLEGRQLKSEQKSQTTDNSPMHNEAAPNIPRHLVSPPTVPTVPTKQSESGDSVQGNKDDFQSTTPGNSPGVGNSFAEDDEDVEQKSQGSINDRHSTTGGNKEDFRPTSPGNSPGVGHSLAVADDDEADVEQRSPAGSIRRSNVWHSVEGGNKEDFRPTSPGNSPGVGHSFAEEDEINVEQKSPVTINRSNDRQSISGDNKEDFRPTNPGHSPGVGHAFVSQKSEPNP